MIESPQAVCSELVILVTRDSCYRYMSVCIKGEFSCLYFCR